MKTGVTTEDITDLVEYSINETKPQVPTRRGGSNEIELKIKRKTFVVKVREKEKKNAKQQSETR